MFGTLECAFLLLAAGANAREVIHSVTPPNYEAVRSRSLPWLAMTSCRKPALANLLFWHGSVLLPSERNIAAAELPSLLEAEQAVRTRWDHCRAVCVVLLKRAPFQQKCLRTHWVRTYVWSLRSLPEWAPEMAIPAGFETE